MLSCGKASSPALAVLRRHVIQAISVLESMLEEASALLRSCGGPRTTSSGSTSLAGAIAARNGSQGLSADARLLILITQTEIEGAA
jgi:diaminopropionate ammonia-lyase